MSACSGRPDRRFLYLWLPWLAAERVLRTQPQVGRPLGLVGRSGSALRLVAVDPVAAAEGLTPGLTLADARSRTPELRTADSDPAADAVWLERLARMALRHSPGVALAPPDGLYLETTGLEPLTGGEAPLLKGVVDRFRDEGLTVRAALADTPGLAFALARFGPGGIAPRGAGPEQLGRLPVSALDLDPDTVELLGDLGLRRVAQLIAMPRPTLAERLGPELLTRIDEALGTRAAALAYRMEVPPHRATLDLADPVAEEAQVLGIARRLAERLVLRLEGEGLGGRRFRLELFRLDGAVKRLEVAASRPLRDPLRVAGLFRERIAALNEGLEADFGFDRLRLSVTQAAPFDQRAGALLETGLDEGDFTVLVDRLETRLGPGSVVRFVPRPGTRLPERAASLEPFGSAPGAAWTEEPAPLYQGVPLRPHRMFDPPQPIEVTAEAPDSPPARITWRRVHRRIVAAEGPERLEPEWGRPGRTRRVRDYYRLEDEEGRRYWVFRSGRYGETEARIEDGRRIEVGSPPRWFLHGLFA